MTDDGEPAGASFGEDADFDPAAYRRALSGFGTGVALVAAHDGTGRAHGLIINSLTSVSLRPPIVLWCLADTSAAFPVFAGAETFSLNILHSGDESLARQFSARGDRIIPPEQIVTLATGAPILAAAVASLDCRLRQRVTMGDHEVIFGDVAAHRADPDLNALGFFRGRYVKLTTGD
ncbi:MAG: flavin reductase family protein [Alphaproteobacteria bacterium]|nr:flavin reductase family protein [Alphaproteobacteria bacterium]